MSRAACGPTALRQASADRPLRLVETRRLADVLEHLAAAPASMVALAWSAERRAEMAELADRIGRRFPQARVVALIDRREPNDEWLARELGAIHVCRSPRQAAAVVRLARRHLGRRGGASIGRPCTTRSNKYGRRFLGILKKDSNAHE